MQCVILAGGLATRLRPATLNIPKSMIKISGKPFLEHQIELLAQNDIGDIVLCVGYLGEQVESYFGDGKKFGISIRYSYEKKQLLGTGGAIRNAAELLNDKFCVLYGDSYLDIDYEGIWSHFLSNGFYALLVVYNNENRWVKSNVVFKNGMVEVYDKKDQITGMKHIDYGLSILSKDAIENIPVNIPYDLARLYKNLASRKKLVGYEVFNRFYEIGSKNGLEEFEDFIEKKE